MNEIDSAMNQMESLYTKAYELGLEYAPKLALAIVTLIIGPLDHQRFWQGDAGFNGKIKG